MRLIALNLGNLIEQLKRRIIIVLYRVILQFGYKLLGMIEGIILSNIHTETSAWK